ncbi:MAG TPA: penicillin-binding protein 2 [Chloroflexota bacterium]
MVRAVSPESSLHVRILILGFIMVSGATFILQHLYWYQFVDTKNLTNRAVAEHEYQQAVPAHRGALLDRNGYPLALSVTYHDVYIYAPFMTSKDQTISKLADILGMPREAVVQRLQQATTQSMLLAERVGANTIAQLQAANLSGVEIRPVSVREYPQGSLAAQVLGFVGKDGKGLSGLELTLDKDLRGQSGLIMAEQDSGGREIGLGRKELTPSVTGSDVILTLDRDIQQMAEQRLAESIKENKGIGGIVIVMEPSTGAILALASQPTYTLAPDFEVDARRQALYKPVAVTDTYEPGSVMKLVTVASAIEEGAVGPESRYFDGSPAIIDGIPIYNWDRQSYGSVTVRQILIYSLNTGAQWVAAQLGADKFYRYLDAFGFGQDTGIALNGEAAGQFRRPDDPNWGRLDLATNSFGQSISATPLQVITAIASLANSGMRMEPELVREIRGPGGAKRVDPQPVRQVVSPQTAATMLDLMVSVWTQPALQPLQIPGYILATKSGTADIPDLGGYNLQKTYASYVGIGPIPDPRFVILVRIDQPVTTWGGTAAAPVVRALADDLFRYLGIPPNTAGVRSR